MKRQLFLLLILISSSLMQLVKAQVTPVVSTVDSPTWYYIESAKNSTVANLGTTAFQDFKDYVIYSPATDGKVLYRKITYTDSEKWAIVNVGGVNKLLNKGTGKYLTASHSVNATGEEFKWTNYTGTTQYKLSTAATNPLMAYNNLTCDRNSDLGANSQTAWYFKAIASTPKNFLGTAITAATNAKAALLGEDPGYIAATSQAVTDLTSAIATAQGVYASTVTDAEYTAAKTTLEAAVTAYQAAPKNPITLSTAGNDTWYYITSANSGYSLGKVLVNQNSTAGTSILFTTKSLDPNKLWKFTDAGNGKVAIQNMASLLYISANPRSGGSSTTAAGFNVTWLADAQLLFKADGQDYLHAQESGSMLVTWATNTLNSASAWKLNKLPAADATKAVDISSITLNQGLYTTTGIGNTDHGLAYFTVNTNGLLGSATIKSVTVDLTGTTNINAVKNLKLYSTGSSDRLNAATHTLVAQITKPATPTTAVEITLNQPLTLPLGASNFYLAADVSETAQEGDVLDNRVLSVKYDISSESNKTFTLGTNTTALTTTVFLKRVVVLKPNDYNSVSYRIPAILTLEDGSILTVTDKRKFHSGDLPGDIDIISRRSTDGGATWSAPAIVALGTGTGKGFGDACIMQAKSGKIVALFVGGNQFQGSTAANPIRSYMSTSTDNGLSWTAPRDLTNDLYGSNCADPVRKLWNGSFFGSGRGLTMRNGRLMAVMTIKPASGNYRNHAIYSDDEGATWKISNEAIDGGDEAKVVELDNNDILMSSRVSGNRLWTKSTDKGINWGPKNNWSQINGNACDADIIRYTSTKDGYNKSRLLHTLPNASDRRNLTMWISYDEGTSWSTKKTLCPGTSAYSSITILPDGTIGVYFEEDGSSAYTMTFINFSLAWLTNGADEYKSSTTGTTKNTKEKITAKVENGHIVISGTDSDYKVFNISGIEFSKKEKISTGVYFVKVENETIKLMVK